MNHADRTPVLVGIGTATRREEDFERALEPMDLMLEAVACAGKDSGSPLLLAGAQYIAVPRGRWSYTNPAGEIARAIGAQRATTVLSSVGVLQQTLIGQACDRIAQGDAHTTLVAGADAGYRLLRAQIAGGAVRERVQGDSPDVFLAPKDELRHPVEKRAGLLMPVGLYAIMESAFRARQGWSIAEHQRRLGELGERFSQVAAANPQAWQRKTIRAARRRRHRARAFRPIPRGVLANRVVAAHHRSEIARRTARPGAQGSKPIDHHAAHLAPSAQPSLENHPHRTTKPGVR